MNNEIVQVDGNPSLVSVERHSYAARWGGRSQYERPDAAATKPPQDLGSVKELVPALCWENTRKRGKLYFCEPLGRKIVVFFAGDGNYVKILKVAGK